MQVQDALGGVDDGLCHGFIRSILSKCFTRQLVTLDMTSQYIDTFHRDGVYLTNYDIRYLLGHYDLRIWGRHCHD